MTQYKLSPKYFLLTAPTLKASRSLCGNSHSAKFSELVQPNQHEKFCEAAVQPTILQKSPLFSKQIDSVREQLAARTQNTITQTKKNNLLKQLNSVLQGSNLQMEEQSKNWQKKRIQTEKRRRQKEEAAIEQIYQKYNEEVARINALREMANSARTDRVVYSALFKKIQWEIKHYQNIYREIIIRTQANRITKGQKHRQASQELQSADQFQTKEQFAQTAFEYNQSMKTPLFMAQLQKNAQARRSNKVKTRRTHQTQKRLREQAEQVQGKINRIVKTVQCANAKDTIEWYTSIASENAKILTLIDQEQLKIQEIQKEIIRITQARRNSEVIEERLVKKLQTLSSMSKPRTLRQIKTSGDLYEESNADFVANLAKKAGIRLTTGRPLTDVVIELQQRLSRQELLNGERRSASNLQSGVDNILSKMQRFDSCERILNKRQFERQYMRQLSKQKKSQRMRK